jgi:hypothetical protein
MHVHWQGSSALDIRRFSRHAAERQTPLPGKLLARRADVGNRKRNSAVTQFEIKS